MDNLKFKISTINCEERIAKLEIKINGKNILEWNDSNNVRTTQFIIDEIIDYLVVDTVEFANSTEDFLYNLYAENILELEELCYSKEFDNENEEIEFFEYVHDYFYQHSIGHASGGAILANLYFRKKDEFMEISWDNREEECDFTYKYGVAYIPLNDYLENIWDLKSKYDKLFK